MGMDRLEPETPPIEKDRDGVFRVGGTRVQLETVISTFQMGCTPEEIRDCLFQVAIYAGIPAGVEAFRIARKVLREEGVLK